MKKQTSLKFVPEKKETTSKFLIDFMKEKTIAGNDFNFDQIEHIRCDKHFELKINFMISETEEYEKYDIICNTCLSELNIKYDDYLKSKLYSGIIKENKEKILQIKEGKVNFELFTMGKSLQVYTHNDIMCLGDELLNFSESFENNVINRFTAYKTTNEEIEKIKEFIESILNEKNEPNLKNIGHNEDLKIRYIQLAYFLIKFKGLKKDEMNFKGLTETLKKHILEIVKKRKKLNKSINQWLKLILREFYPYTHELEDIPLDEKFLNEIPMEYIDKSLYEENEKLKKIISEMLIEREQIQKVIKKLNLKT